MGIVLAGGTAKSLALGCDALYSSARKTSYSHMKTLSAALVLLAASLAAQTTPQEQLPTAPSQQLAEAKATTATGETVEAARPPCVRPAHLLEIKEYHGPFAKFGAALANKPNILTTHTPHANVSDHLCSLNAGEKFHLFVSDTINPFSFVESAFNAGLAQMGNDDPQWGQGMKGYGRRYAADLADNASDEFFTTFLYPAVFRQDPRYYRVAHGPVHKRALHAFNHVFVAHSDSGHLMFNYSEWLGTVSSQALGNVYHPGNEPGLRPLGRAVGWSVVQDVGWNMLREFWPEFSNHLHIPFVTIEHAK